MYVIITANGLKMLISGNFSINNTTNQGVINHFGSSSITPVDENITSSKLDLTE